MTLYIIQISKLYKSLGITFRTYFYLIHLYIKQILSVYLWNLFFIKFLGKNH